MTKPYLIGMSVGHLRKWLAGIPADTPIGIRTTDGDVWTLNDVAAPPNCWDNNSNQPTFVVLSIGNTIYGEQQTLRREFTLNVTRIIR